MSVDSISYRNISKVSDFFLKAFVCTSSLFQSKCNSVLFTRRQNDVLVETMTMTPILQRNVLQSEK